MGTKLLASILGRWDPYRIDQCGFREVRIRLKLRWWNKNANRTQYGGSIFSLTDPVYALMLMGILGERYYVWDKEASINFIKPGDTDFFAEFRITQEMLDWILASTAEGDKCFPEFIVHVKNARGEVVSEVQRKLYVRKKPQYRESVSECIE